MGNKVKQIVVTGIEWDAPKSAGLPEEVTIDITEENKYLLEDIDGGAENLSDYLSDTYGYCHFGFAVDCECQNNNEDMVRDIAKIYHMTASNEEMSLYVCFATSREKAILLTKEWIEKMGGPEEIDGVYAFRLFIIDVDRIGFNDNVIQSGPIEVTYEELVMKYKYGEPASYYD